MESQIYLSTYRFDALDNNLFSDYFLTRQVFPMLKLLGTQGTRTIHKISKPII